MKYQFRPHTHVIDNEKNKRMFVFDANGEFETDDPKLIEWIKRNKKFLKPIEENKAAEVKTEETEKDEKKAEAVVYKCNKCSFEADNKGSLMAHYRKDHPKKSKR